MARNYDNLGRGDDIPVVNRQAQPDTSKVDMTDWTVLARIDGKRSVDDLVGLLPLGEVKVIESLVRLKALGMIHINNDTQGLAQATFGREMTGGAIRPPRSNRSLDAKGGDSKKKDKKKTSIKVSLPTNWPISVEQFMFDPIELEQEIELDLEKRKQVLYYHYHLKRVSYYELFQVESDADRRTIRKSYFKLSKEFHPDLFFRKELGTFKRRVEEIFQWISKGYGVLTDEKRRAEYDALLSRGLLGDRKTTSPVPQPSPSMSIREQLGGKLAGPRQPQRGSRRPGNGVVQNNVIRAAKQAESQGQWDRAWVLYKKQLQLGFDATTAHRAARCLLELDRGLTEAEALCRQALSGVHDAGSRTEVALTLAQILEQLRREEEARDIYAEVLRLDPGHQVARMQLDRLSQPS